MKLIVGLGNPDKKYTKTRHNAGFMVLDELKEDQVDFSDWQEDKKFKAMISEGRLNEDKVILAKPLTYMNNSGQTVKFLVDYYKIDKSDITLVHDDIDIPLGKIKIKKTGSSAGHKGVQSVIDYLKTSDFTRIRIGIQPDSGRKQPSENIVLKKFGLFEKKQINQGLTEAVKVIKEIIS